MKIAAEQILVQMKEAMEEVFNSMLDTVAKLVLQAGPDRPGEAAEHIDVEAVVEFSGEPSGAVILRAETAGATDLARKMLMMEEGEAIELEEIQDALGECANMVTGSLKTRALDPFGTFELSTPRIDRRVNVHYEHRGGRLVYELSKGNVAVEIWLSEEPV